MEIDVTSFVSDAEPFNFSASRAERGADAGPETWANAIAEAGERPLLASAEQLEAARRYFEGFGAWDEAEVAAWTPADLNALTIQYISGDLREAESLAPGDGPGGIDWDAYAALQSEGTCSSVLFLAAGDRVFAYLGS